ncbi:MAG TPA: hypothetical protein IAC86_07340 [Candidatus Cryptobacteroides excrementigallinarum]|nr:hypothetical protein [Candidatus Cryptobacteroides excrementigallinarum]
MNNKASSILQNAKALLLTGSAALCLCLLTGCSHEELPETGKYNTMIVLRGDGTKALAPDEAQSIVIYAFSHDTNDLVGYLYEATINGRDIFPMNLTAGGQIDFYVILNPVCNGFEIIDNNNQLVNFDPHEGITPDIIQNWKLRRTRLEPDEAVPMSNLEEQVDGYHNPTGESNRTFEVVADRNSWQEIPIQVTRAVSKVEVWFWANDNWTNPPWNYSSIDSQVLTDPVSESMVFDRNSTDYSSTRREAKNEKPYHTNGTQGNLNDEKFKEYEAGTLFYNENYFKLIWEQYILPNTLYGGDNMGQTSESGTDCTTLKIDYTYHYQYNTSGTGRWPDYEWGEEPQENKTIYLPASSRNTIIKVWCALRDDTDRSFTYQVVDWDESVTVDIPDFD